MNNIKFALAIATLILFKGCSSTQQFYYNSSADLPQFTSSTETVMNVVLNDTDNLRSYGIITAVDNGTQEYLLLARKNYPSSYNSLGSFNITYATNLSLESAKELNESLDVIISNWDGLTNDDGYFYQFTSAPINETVEVAPNVLQYEVSVSFYFTAIGGWSIGELIFRYKNLDTHEITTNRVEMQNKSDLEDLQSLLNIALSYFDY